LIALIEITAGSDQKAHRLGRYFMLYAGRAAA
jgi:hypothetical protein